MTYEFPPETGKGGIATYTKQAISVLARMGHDVEVFCGTSEINSYYFFETVRINKVNASNHEHFVDSVVSVFSQRHNIKPFDVIEVPEINGNAIRIKHNYPHLPLLVKLHTPAFLVVQLNNYSISKLVKFRYFIGSIRRGRFRFYSTYHNKEEDVDYIQTIQADHIVSPSISLKEKIIEFWGIGSIHIGIVPNLYVPSDLLLNYPVNKNNNSTVLFIGKLNEHKGLVNLVKAIPRVVSKFPNVKFKLVGADGFFSKKNIPMSQYIKNELKGFENNFLIIGPIENEEIQLELGNSEICVFPSMWENFPMVCLEAMSAGCSIIGSNNGGMSEMLANDAGILINPKSPWEIANAINDLLEDNNLRHRLGLNARLNVLNSYNEKIIGDLMLDSYLEAINNCSNINCVV